jgi:hypothetical protein
MLSHALNQAQRNFLKVERVLVRRRKGVGAERRTSLADRAEIRSTNNDSRDSRLDLHHRE